MRVRWWALIGAAVVVALSIGLCCPAFAVGIEVLSIPKEEAPGSFVTHVYTVTNDGTDTTPYRLTFEAPAGWGVLGAPDEITIAPGSEETLFVTLTIPPGALAGTYDIALAATAQDDPADTASATARVIVTPTREIEFVEPTGSAVSPGGSVDYTFVLVNRGNTHDSFTIEASSSRQLGTTLSTAAVDLAPQERAEIHVRLDVPKDAAPGRDVLTVIATSSLYDDVEADAAVFSTILPPGPETVDRVLMEILPVRIRLSLDKDVLDDEFASRLTFSTSGQILGGFFSSNLSLSDPLGPDPLEVGSFSILYRRSPATYSIGNVSQRMTELIRLSCQGGLIVFDEELFDLSVIAGGSEDETRFAGRLAIGPEVVNLGIAYLGIRDAAPTYRSVWSLTADAEPLEDWTIGIEGALGIDGQLSSRAFLFTTEINTSGLFFYGTAYSVGTNFPGSLEDSAGIELSYRLRLNAISLSASLGHVWDNVIRDPAVDTLIQDELGFNLSATPLEDGPTLTSTVDFEWDRAPLLSDRNEIDTLFAVSVTETSGVFPYTVSGKITDQIDHVFGTHVRRSTFSQGAGLSVDSFYLFLQLAQEKQVDMIQDVVLSSSSDVSIRFRPEGPLHEASIAFGNTIDEFDLSASLYIRFLENLDIVFDGSIAWDRVDSNQISFGWGITFNADVALPIPFFVTKGQIEGRVFVDRDGDGRYSLGDRPVSGIIVEASGAEASTDADGFFRFTPSYPGTYELTVGQLPSDAAAGEPTVVDLASGRTVRVEVPLMPVATITGQLFDDANQDGIRDAEEGGFAQVRILLSDEFGVVDDTSTDAAGDFSFFDVLPGRYTIAVDVATLPDRFEFTTPEATTLDVAADAPSPVRLGGFVRPREVIITFQPPTADFEFAPDAPIAGDPISFDGTLSFDFDGTIVAYTWDFDGDGAADATDATAQYMFATAGSYDVSLTVTDDSDNSDTVTVTIAVAAVPEGGSGPSGITALQPPIADFAFVPATPSVGDTIQFDGTLSSDFDGTIVAYAWDFDGDGTADETDPIASHTFPTPGLFPVTLTVTDDSGNTDVLSVPIEIGGEDGASQGEEPIDETPEPDAGLPVAAIQYSPRDAIAGEPVLFNGTSSLDPDGQVTGFAWDFDGDGETDSTAPLAEHTFPEAGTYTVALTAFDGEGNSASTTTTIVVAPPSEGGDGIQSFQPPVADFAYMPAAPNAGDPILFNGTFSTDFDGEVVGFAWDFDGDGATDSTDAIAEHSFPTAGRYAVSLTVTDDGGNRDTLTISIDVE